MKMTTTRSLLVLSLLLLISLTATLVVSSSDHQVMISRRRVTVNEDVRMTATGNGNVDNDDIEEDEVDRDDDDDDAVKEGDDDDIDDHPIPTADIIYRCTERGTTNTPIYPFCPEGFPDRDDDEDIDDDYGSGDMGDDAVSYDKDCEAVRSGSEISPNDYVYQLTYQIDLALEIDGDVAETLARLEEFLQMNIATDLTGCNPDSAVSVDVDLQHVMFDVEEDTESKPYCDTCTNTDVSADVRYNEGVDDSLIEGAIYDAFIARCTEMKDIEGVVDTFDPCPTIAVNPAPTEPSPSQSPADSIAETEPPIIDDGGVPVPDEDDTNSTDVAPVVEQIEKSSSDDKDLTGAGIFGIVLLFLVLLAFLVFFMHRRRRRNNDRRRLAKLDQNDTFMIDDGNTGSPGRFSDGDDSMIDSRYGMYPEGQTEGMILGSRKLNQDVHKCSSATCNLCEARRQSNITFLPTTNGGILGIRPLVHADALPPTSDATKSTSRSYEVEDTVVL